MKSSPGQSEFDFDRGERLALLDELPLESGEAIEGGSRKNSVKILNSTLSSTDCVTTCPRENDLLTDF